MGVARLAAVLATATFGFALPTNDQPYGMALQQSTCPDGCLLQPTPSVHGDPMFKVNGTGTHFWIKAGKLTPLLSWMSGGATMELSGRTFNNAETGNQWFDELLISTDGSPALRVTIVSGDTKIKFDGKLIKPSNSAATVRKPACRLVLPPCALIGSSCVLHVRVQRVADQEQWGSALATRAR